MKAAAHRILGILGIALAGAALFAGGVQAAERPDDRAGLIGVGATQVVAESPDAFERAVLRHAGAVPVPDVFERAVLRETGTATRPDDRAGARGPGIVPAASPSVAASAEGGARWDEALLAVAMLGVLLLGIAATLTIRHRGRMALR